VPTDVISLIIKDRTVENTVATIHFALSPTDKNSYTLIVSGLAKTRQSLVAFSEALRKEPLIQKVDLPVSNLTKESNIQFTLTITGHH
jgi:hypothetical protein